MQRSHEKMILRCRQQLADSNKGKLSSCQQYDETNKLALATETDNMRSFLDPYVSKNESSANSSCSSSSSRQDNRLTQQISTRIPSIPTQLSTVVLMMSIVALLSACCLCLADQATLHEGAQSSVSNLKINSRQDSNLQQQQQLHISRPSPPGLQVARANHRQAYVEPLSSSSSDTTGDNQAAPTALDAERSIDRFDSGGQEHQIRSPLLRQPTTLPPLAAASNSEQVSIGEGTSLQAAASQDSSYLSPEERGQLSRSQESHYEGRGLGQQPSSANELADLGGSSSNNPESQLNRPPASDPQSSNEVDESDYEDDSSEPANEQAAAAAPASRPSQSLADERRRAAATAKRRVLQRQQQQQGASPDSSLNSSDDDDSSDDYKGPASDDAHFNRKSLQDRQQAEQLVAAKSSNRATTTNNDNSNNNNDYNPEDDGPESMKRPDNNSDDSGSLDGSDSGNGGDDESSNASNSGAGRFDRGPMSGGGEQQAQSSGGPPYVAPINRNAQKFYHSPKAPLASNSALHGSTGDDGYNTDSPDDSNDNSEDDSNANGAGGEELQALSGSGSNNNNVISRLTPTSQRPSSTTSNQNPPIYDSPHLKVIVKTVQQPIQRVGLTNGYQALPKTVVLGQQTISLSNQRKTAQPLATAASAHSVPYNPQNNPSHAGKYFIN